MAISYCFKAYTDCRKNNKHKNGKSPLEVAGVSTKSLIGLDILLKVATVNWTLQLDAST